ncbi:MAG: hypothetical protein ABMA00_19805 [Gemmatimonas sp.]
MNIEAIKVRLKDLLQDAQGSADFERQNRVHQGTLGLLHSLYGRDSSRERELRGALERLAKIYHPTTEVTVASSMSLIRGVLQSIQADVDAGALGSLRDAITGDVLSDLIKLARTVAEDTTDGGKNVSAVLAAAAFEDCLRRLAASVGVPHHDKLADIVTVLKEKDVLQGAQVGIAQSYLSFRNRALHAKWAEVDRPEVASVLGFTEALLVKHFS